MKISFNTENKELINIVETTAKAYNIKTNIMDFTNSTYITLFNVETIDYNIEKEVIIFSYNHIGLRFNIKDIIDLFIDKTK